MFSRWTLWRCGPAVLQKHDLIQQRKAAARLGRLQNPEAVDLLLKSLADPITSTYVDNEGNLPDRVTYESGHLVAALASSGKSALGPLLAILRQKKSDHFHACAANALGRIGSRAAIEPLVPLLWHDGAEVREAAAEALAQLGWEPANDEQKAAVFAARFQFDRVVTFGAAAVRSLCPWATGRGATDHCQCEAIRALAKIGDRNAVEPLKRVVDEELFDSTFTPNGGEVALQALVALGEMRAVSKYVTRHKNGKLRAAAAKALAGANGASVVRGRELARPAPDQAADQAHTVAAVAEGLWDSHAVVKDAAVATLRTMDSPQARDIIAKWDAGIQKQKAVISGGHLQKLLRKNLDVAKMLEGVYQIALSRLPRPEEREQGLDSMAGMLNNGMAWQNLLWKLMWSKEFFGM